MTATHVIDLFIGPDPSAVAHLGATLDVWRHFTERLAAPLAFEVDSLNETQFDQNCSGIAVAMPKLRNPPRPDLGRIAFSDKFFLASPDEQFSTVLHESIHMGLLTGPFRDRFSQGYTLDRRECVRVVDQCSDRRYYLAFLFRNVPDEVAAEWYLQRQYPSHREVRVRHYLAMRRGNARNPLQDGVPTALKPYAHFYELVRLELGVRISQGTGVEAEMTAMRNEVSAQLGAAGYDAQAVTRLRGSMEHLQAIPADSTTVHPVADDVFEQVLRVDCPSPSTTTR